MFHARVVGTYVSVGTQGARAARVHVKFLAEIFQRVTVRRWALTRAGGVERETRSHFGG